MPVTQKALSPSEIEAVKSILREWKAILPTQISTFVMISALTTWVKYVCDAAGVDYQDFVDEFLRYAKGEKQPGRIIMPGERH